MSAMPMSSKPSSRAACAIRSRSAAAVSECCVSTSSYPDRPRSPASIIAPMSSPSLLYSAAQVRALDAYAIAQGTDGYTLMRRAAEAALRALRSRWPTAMKVAVLTGGGNNGGDGYVLARFAQAAGLAATVLAVVPPEQLRGDALRACEDFRASGGRIITYEPALLADTDVVVDALLGTGLREPVRPAT